MRSVSLPRMKPTPGDRRSAQSANTATAARVWRRVGQVGACRPSMPCKALSATHGRALGPRSTVRAHALQDVDEREIALGDCDPEAVDADPSAA